MRVTQSGMWEMIRRNLSQTAERTRVIEEQAVGGMLVNRPSDAPELLVEIDRLHASGMDQDVFTKNSAQSLAQLEYLAIACIHAEPLCDLLRQCLWID